MTLTFNIPDNQFKRILDSLGYAGYNDILEQENFIKRLTVSQWESFVFEYERNLAEDKAEQSRTFINLSDIE